MSPRTIPAEIVGIFCEFTHNDADLKTLRSCAMVSRTWHFASRPYIFHAIILTTDARCTEFEELLGREPSIGPFVHTLTVRPVVGQIQTPSPWLERVVDAIPEKLPHLATIRFVKLYDFGEHITTPFVQRLGSFSSVRHLAIENSSLNMSLVLALASALPRLRHLHIGLLLPLPLLIDGPTPQLYPPTLHSLHLDMGDMYPYGTRELTEWTLSGPSRESLTTLRIVVSLINMVPAGQFIITVGPQLRELDLKVDIRLPAPVEAEVVRLDLSLATCSALEVLTLRHHSPMSRLTMELLSEVSAPRVKSLTLGTLTTDDGAALPDFAPLQGYIPPLWMDSLMEECVLYSGRLSDDVVLAKIRSDLPELHAHGTLKVVRE